MTTLRATISQLANQFASGVLEAIRGASLAEILAESGERGAGGGTGARRGRPPAASGGATGGRPAKRTRGRLERRSAKDIAGVVRQIVDLLGAHPEGLRAEQIRRELGLQAKELPRPIAEALSSRKIAKQGQKRATTYFAKGSKGASPKAAKSGSKVSKTAGKKPGKRSSAKKRGGKKIAGPAAVHTNGASASA
jgi:hypothetical protein